jgi:cellulose synthase/poly-beta-1,6-N-acetylglucosamine synthase-like glycosyltransferase
MDIERESMRTMLSLQLSKRKRKLSALSVYAAILDLSIALLIVIFVIPLLGYDIYGMLENILTEIRNNYWIYVPLGTIGVWRWGVWIIKKTASQFYKPIHSSIPSYSSKMTIVTPVYRENPNIFKIALKSWAENRPDELIAVIDHTDTDCIRIFKEFSQDRPWAKLIITLKPGKRAALADGIRAAEGSIVALTDSDTVWAPNIRDKLLAPFRYPHIGGVTTRVHPISRLTIWQKMTDIFWDIRNFNDLPSQSATGQSLSCLSGRTSLYRRSIIVPKLDLLLNETILNKRKESGEDKCLTRLVQREGWKTYYQSNAVIYSSAAADFRTFWKQRVRWSRNSHNSDLFSLWERWAWKRYYLTFYMIDRLITTFTLFLGPIYFGLAIYLNQYAVALSILILWLVGRGIKIFPHIRRHPHDIMLLPVFVLVNFMLAVIKLYSLVTITEQKWIREGEDRKRGLPIIVMAKNISITSAIIGNIVAAVILIPK